jgi:hypothetical protein
MLEASGARTGCGEGSISSTKSVAVEWNLIVIGPTSETGRPASAIFLRIKSSAD